MPEKDLYKQDINGFIDLLPFDSKEVKEFLEKYYYPNTPPIKFEDIKKYGLKEEIFKPLFCWMLTRIQSEFDLSVLDF